MEKQNAYDFFLKADDNARKILLATLDGVQCKADIARKSGVNKVTVAYYVNQKKKAKDKEGVFSSSNLDLLEYFPGRGDKKFQYYIRVKHDIKTFIIISSVVLDTFSLDEIKQFMNSKYVREQNETTFDKYKFELILFYNIFKTNLIKNNNLEGVFSNIRNNRAKQSVHLDSMNLFSDITKFISTRINDPKNSKKVQSLGMAQTTRDIVIGVMNDDDVLTHLEHFVKDIFTNIENGLPMDEEGNVIVNKQTLLDLPSYLRKIPALQQPSFIEEKIILDHKEMTLLDNQLQIDISQAISMIFGGPVWEDYKWIFSHSPTALKMICTGGWRFADESFLMPLIHQKAEKSFWGRIVNDDFLKIFKKDEEVFKKQILIYRKGLLSVIYHSLAIDILSGKLILNPGDERFINRIVEAFDNSFIWVNRDIDGTIRKTSPF